jgi:hypothetical protein
LWAAAALSYREAGASDRTIQCFARAASIARQIFSGVAGICT